MNHQEKHRPSVRQPSDYRNPNPNPKGVRVRKHVYNLVDMDGTHAATELSTLM